MDKEQAVREVGCDHTPHCGWKHFAPVSGKGLSVIVPSRDSSNFVPCAEAVRRHEPALRIVLIDDMGQMGLSWLPRPDLDPCVGFATDWLFIYARNCNKGIELAGQDDVVLLNDDALLQTPGGFTMLQKAAEEHPEYGVIAATTNNVGNRSQFPQGIGLREDPRMVCFVAVLIPRRTIDAVGLLDERFVGYGCDDDDYCLRVRKAGLKIGIHDGCFVDHKSLHSTFRGDARNGGNYLSNLEIFKRKWGRDNWGNKA